MRRSNLRWPGGLLAIGLLVTACQAGSGGSAPASTAASTAPSAPASASDGTPEESLAPFSCSLPAHAAATIDRAQITRIAVAAHESYDRIVFEFQAGLPEYTIERAVPPLIADASGLPIAVKGASFLRIVLHGGTVTLPDGGVSYDGPKDFSPTAPSLIELKSGGDFEAVATWYAGLSAERCIRVFTLTAPSRLVIDVEH
jgi:hypothetical protein